MACFRPVRGYPAAPPARGVVWSPHQSYAGAKALSLPCGRCIGCRIDRSKQWALRCVHEASLYQKSAFITLTYNDQSLPSNYSVHLPDLQRFFKRLRKAGYQFRYFAVGEYGERTLRPHYHAILFGIDFADKVPVGTGDGYVRYSSDTLFRHWGHGRVECGDVNYATAAYCARYTMKKIGGEKAAEHYSRINPLTGELVQVQPEFCVMSRRPGIGASWYDKFAGDCFPSDYLVHDGQKVSVPAYYHRKFKAAHEAAPELVPMAPLRVKAARAAKSFRSQDDKTPDRLEVREEVLALKLQRLKRNLEE